MARLTELADRSIGLGTAQLAFKPISAEEGIRVIHAALDAGVRLIDTALAYTRLGEESYAEQLVARALSGRTESVLLATKGGHFRRGDAFPIDASARALRSHVETSLRNLRVDSIDLYQLHHVDPSVPLFESVAALAALQAEGKIVEIGLSNVDISQIRDANAIARIGAVQNRLGFSDRGDLTTAAFCAESDIVYLAYMPLGGTKGRESKDDARAEIARMHGVSVERLTLAWLIAASARIVPLVGATRPATIADSALAATLELSPRELSRIDAASTN